PSIGRFHPSTYTTLFRSARRERWLGVEDFTDRAETGLVEMTLKGGEKTAGARVIVGVNLQPGVDERADQPGPHRALVIGRVARAQVAEVFRLVIGIAGSQRTQTDRSEQALRDHLQDRSPV